LYLPTIPENCEYNGPPLPTKEEYFKQANVKKNLDLVESKGNLLLEGKIGRDPLYVVTTYLSFGKTRKSKGKGNPKKKKSSRRKKSR
jgi:hypothetical protein